MYTLPSPWRRRLARWHTWFIQILKLLAHYWAISGMMALTGLALYLIGDWLLHAAAIWRVLAILWLLATVHEMMDGRWLVSVKDDDDE